MILILKIFHHFERKIIEKCKSEKPEILEAISKSGKLEEDTENLLVETIKELKKTLTLKNMASLDDLKKEFLVLNLHRKLLKQ